MHDRHASRAALVGGSSALALVALVLFIPFMALGAGFDPAGAPTGACGQAVDAEDGTPTILGSAELTASDIQAWWRSSRSGQPGRLRIPIAQLIETYLTEGDAEGVRGDLAFAQAVHETGWFTNSDTAINNFAGIAHYDGTGSGSGFPDPASGVRAQIQLLKKFAEGNDVRLARPDVAPNAGARATTWGQLAGSWATDPGYWDALSTMFTSMKAGAAPVGDRPPPGLRADSACTTAVGNPEVVGNYALPVDRRWWDEHPEWFTKPHHDYPAADIPVPTGTPLYAITSGTIVSTPTSDRCGYGIVLNGDDGAQYTYCHGLPGSHWVSPGDTVSAGQLLLQSASTGNSTGPHLHLAIVAAGSRRCPQALLDSIGRSGPYDPLLLPTTGCQKGTPLSTSSGRAKPLRLPRGVAETIQTRKGRNATTSESGTS